MLPFQTYDRKNAAELIRKHKSEILESWVNKVRAGIPAAAPKTKIQLLDSVPEFIDNLIATLEAENPVHEFQINTELVREHAQDRATQEEYSLEQMIYEYHLLRFVLLEYLNAKNNFDLKTNQVLHGFMDASIRKATTEYVGLESEKNLNYINQMQQLHQLTENNTLELSKTVRALEHEKELRDRFVAALTHDLRTPLTSAKMGAQLIERKSEGNEFTITIAKRIVESMDRADQMIRNLLDANRIKAGESFPLTLELCDLNGIIQTGVHELTGIYGPRFKILGTEQAISGYWDRDAVVRIIENLGSNAIKYGGNQSAVTLTLSQSAGWVQMAVHNTGNPIEEDDLKRIFDPYGRATSSVLSGQIGWGVGLTLVKGIVEALGGSIDVQSSLHAGTTFLISLPLDSRKKDVR